MIIASSKIRNIGDREDKLLHLGEIITQPIIIKRVATEQDYIDYWKDNPNWDPNWKRWAFNNGFHIVAYYEVYTD